VLGAMNLTENLLPHLSDTAKVVNLSSFYGALRYHPESTQRKFSDPNISKQDIIDAIDLYIKEAKNQKMVSFSPNVYATSKMLLGAWSRFVVQYLFVYVGKNG
jgi:NAD(P)-dependent dehydrogenase (short-subunit alcohol dehydrogenase family)